MQSNTACLHPPSSQNQPTQGHGNEDWDSILNCEIRQHFSNGTCKFGNTILRMHYLHCQTSWVMNTSTISHPLAGWMNWNEWWEWTGCTWETEHTSYATQTAEKGRKANGFWTRRQANPTSIEDSSQNPNVWLPALKVWSMWPGIWQFLTSSIFSQIFVFHKPISIGSKCNKSSVAEVRSWTSVRTQTFWTEHKVRFEFRFRFGL